MVVNAHLLFNNFDQTNDCETSCSLLYCSKSSRFLDSINELSNGILFTQTLLVYFWDIFDDFWSKIIVFLDENQPKVTVVESLDLANNYLFYYDNVSHSSRNFIKWL